MEGSLILLSVLIIIWWIAIWGLIEIVLKMFVGNSTTAAVVAYMSMILFVVIILAIYPRLIERFI